MRISFFPLRSCLPESPPICSLPPVVENAPGLLSPKVHDYLLALIRPELDAPALVRVVAVVVVAVLLLLLLLAALALALRLLAGLAVEGAPNGLTSTRFQLQDQVKTQVSESREEKPYHFFLLVINQILG